MSVTACRRPSSLGCVLTPTPLRPSWRYSAAETLCGDGGAEAGAVGRVSVGPQDLEEQVEVAYTRPGDGLGFCAACKGHFCDPNSVSGCTFPGCVS